MMKKYFFLVVFMLCSFGMYAQIQTLTINNTTDSCDIFFYSGNVIVDGNPYLFGSEVADGAIVPAGGIDSFSVDGNIGLALPGYTGPQSTPTQPLISVIFEGFKIRAVEGGGSAYIAFNQPFTLSDPAGCYSNQPYTIVWTVFGNAITVYIL